MLDPTPASPAPTPGAALGLLLGLLVGLSASPVVSAVGLVW